MKEFRFYSHILKGYTSIVSPDESTAIKRLKKAKVQHSKLEEIARSERADFDKPLLKPVTRPNY